MSDHFGNDRHTKDNTGKKITLLEEEIKDAIKMMEKKKKA